MLLGSEAGALVLKVCRGGDHKGWGGTGPRITGPGGSSPALVTQGFLSRRRGWATSYGLIVAHVPDLSSLGLLVQQSEACQVF